MRPPLWFTLVLLGGLCPLPVLHARLNVTEMTTLHTPSPITTFALAQSGRIAGGVCKDGAVRLWALPDGRLLRSLEPATNQFIFVSFSRDGRLLQTSTWTGDVMVWDTATGKAVFRMQVPKYAQAVAFSRDNRFLAAATSFGPVQVMELGSHRKLYELDAVAGGTQMVAFSPDGTRIATADSDARVRLYDFQTGQLRASREAFAMSPLAIDFTADGREIVAAGGDKQAVFFDAITGEVTRRLKRQAHPVGYVEGSPDGQALATVHFNAVGFTLPAPLIIWDAAAGHRIQEWVPPSGVVASAWIGDGHLIAATLTPEAAHIWQVR
jgi:WD40 repeat protein